VRSLSIVINLETTAVKFAPGHEVRRVLAAVVAATRHDDDSVSNALLNEDIDDTVLRDTTGDIAAHVRIGEPATTPMELVAQIRYSLVSEAEYHAPVTGHGDGQGVWWSGNWRWTPTFWTLDPDPPFNTPDLKSVNWGGDFMNRDDAVAWVDTQLGERTIDHVVSSATSDNVDGEGELLLFSRYQLDRWNK
jgi:hypothetical protein